MAPFSSQGEQYWVGGGGGLFGPPAENFGMTSITFFLPSCRNLYLYRLKCFSVLPVICSGRFQLVTRQ